MKLRIFLADVRGAALPLVALLLPVIIGMAGLGVDASLYYPAIPPSVTAARTLRLEISANQV